MALLSHLVKETPRWKMYLAHMADMPDLPAPTAMTAFSMDGEIEQQTPRNWPRRLAILAAGPLLLGGAGLVAWKFGALARPTEPTQWLVFLGALLGLPLLWELGSWGAKKWLPFRLKL
jgi:hypothetical protein